MRGGHSEVREEVGHGRLIRAPVKVDVTLLKCADIQGRQSLHCDGPEEAQGTQRVVVRVKGLHGRDRLVVDHAKLQLAGGLVLAHGSGWPRFARANISSTLGKGLCGKGVFGGHGGSGPERGASKGEVAGGGAHGGGSRAPQGQGTRYQASGQRVRRGIGRSFRRALWATPGTR